ncbi:hypothetical protein ACRAWC_04580 [Leifsonia sp. L25]|uniref:hypothetical protein n=1 Tax=Leifsonia sp. L25 TaxID=3423957 RepID=UPI003D686AF1
MSSSTIFLLRMPSPIGRIELTGDGDAVTSLSIARDDVLPTTTSPRTATPCSRRRPSSSTSTSRARGGSSMSRST